MQCLCSQVYYPQTCKSNLYLIHKLKKPKISSRFHQMDSIFLLPGSLTTTVSPRWNFISLLSLPRTIFSPSLHFLPLQYLSISLIYILYVLETVQVCIRCF
uniref:Uncharacterized protein n=1 Tax=Cacopsylla melanoneura TaxID=428564 RepID=A0A8D8X591_9HEMI